MFSLKQDLASRREKAIMQFPEISKVEELLKRFNFVHESSFSKDLIEFLRPKNVTLIISQECEKNGKPLKDVKVKLEISNTLIEAKSFAVEEFFSIRYTTEYLLSIFSYYLEKEKIKFDVYNISKLEEKKNTYNEAYKITFEI